MASGVGTVLINIVGNADRLRSALGDAENATDSFSDKLGNAGKKMTLLTTVPVLGFLGAATKAAVEDAAAQDNLAKTLQNTVGATKDEVAAVEAYIAKAMKASTFTDDELRPAFAALTRETRNTKEANELLHTAMDLSVAKGIPLEAATTALVKAHNGQTKSLKDLGIELKTTAVDLSAVRDFTDDIKSLTIDYTAAVAKHGAESAEAEKIQIRLKAAQDNLKDAQKGGLEVARSFGDIMKDVNATVGGQAAAAADTAGGKMQNLKRDMGELTESIGGALLPVLSALIEKIQPLLDKFMAMDESTQKWIVVTALAVAAIGPLITIIASLTTALTFLAANPIVITVAAIALLAATLVKAYQDSETFRDVVNGVFQAVVNGVADAIGWILDGIAQFIGGLARVAEAASSLPGIGDKFKGIAETLRGAQHDVDGWSDAMHKGIDLVTSDAERAKKAFEAVGQAARSDLGNLSQLGLVAAAGRPGAAQTRAAGGPVWPGQAFLVGEQGPELFVPGRAGTIVPNGGGGTVINVNVSGALDPAGVARQIQQLLLQEKNRSGPLGLS